MENIETTERVVDNKTKKSVERSAAYPVYSIETSLQFTSDFYKQFRSNVAKRDDVANLIKGYSNSKIASCGHYGLLEREKDGYRITDRYNNIANYVVEKEKTAALLEAFETPTLYKELIEKFDGGVVPENLHVHLFRFHRITEAVAPNAAEVFITNAKYIGVLSESNILNFKQAVRNISGEAPVMQGAAIVNSLTAGSVIAQQNTGEPSQQSALTDPTNSSQQSQQLLLTETTNHDKLTIKLTDGKRAYLSYPNDINEKDVAILKLQLEALSLTL